jgi:hypothetical protein
MLRVKYSSQLVNVEPTPEKMLEFDTSYEVMVTGMTTGIQKARRIVRLILVLALTLPTLPAYAQQLNQSRLENKVIGEWIVAQMVVARGFNNAQLSHLNSASADFARVYNIQSDGTLVDNELAKCRFDTRYAQQHIALKSLFESRRLLRLPATAQRPLGTLQQYPSLSLTIKNQFKISDEQKVKIMAFAQARKPGSKPRPACIL